MESFEYKVLRWKTKNSKAVNQFFIKPHSPIGSSTASNKRKPIGRTLLVLNVPPYLSRVNVAAAFKNFGLISHVILQDTPSSSIPERQDPLFQLPKDVIKGFQVAYVVFQEPEVLKELMTIETNDIAPIVIKNIRSGLSSWISQYNAGVVSTEVLEQNVKDFLHKFEKKEIQKKLAEEQQQADAEGWVTVTRKGKGKRQGAIRTEAMEERLKEKRKKWETRLLNFTPTQVKETRAKQLQDLKRKFDDDRQRIALLRQQRKFKPF